jgi:hypothetical protein
MSAATHPFPNAKSARRGRYYGWTNVALAALAMVGTLPGRTQGLGLITEPLLADLRIDRVSYAAINLWATLIGSLFCLPCGRLLDRLQAPRRSRFLNCSRLLRSRRRNPRAVKPELANVKALVFDTFGTVVDWRSSVIAERIAAPIRRSTVIPACEGYLRLRPKPLPTVGLING